MVEVTVPVNKKDLSNMSKIELCYELQSATTLEEYRAIHKELKKYGDGLPFHILHPNFPYYFSLVTLAISVCVLVWKISSLFM